MMAPVCNAVMDFVTITIVLSPWKLYCPALKQAAGSFSPFNRAQTKAFYSSCCYVQAVKTLSSARKEMGDQLSVPFRVFNFI